MTNCTRILMTLCRNKCITLCHNIPKCKWVLFVSLYVFPERRATRQQWQLRLKVNNQCLRFDPHSFCAQQNVIIDGVTHSVNACAGDLQNVSGVHNKGAAAARSAHYVMTAADAANASFITAEQAAYMEQWDCEDMGNGKWLVCRCFLWYDNIWLIVKIIVFCKLLFYVNKMFSKTKYVSLLFPVWFW